MDCNSSCFITLKLHHKWKCVDLTKQEYKRIEFTEPHESADASYLCSVTPPTISRCHPVVAHLYDNPLLLLIVLKKKKKAVRFRDNFPNSWSVVDESVGTRCRWAFHPRSKRSLKLIEPEAY